MHRNEVDARPTNLQFGKLVDGDVRLKVADVIQLEALAEKISGQISGRIEFALQLFTAIAPCVESRGWIQGLEISVAADMVPVCVRNEDRCQWRQAGRMPSQGFVSGFS